MAWPFDLLNLVTKKFPVGSDEWNLLQALCRAAAKSLTGGGGSYELVYQPDNPGPLATNAFTDLALLAVAAQKIPGEKLVTFDPSFQAPGAPMPIAAGHYDFRSASGVGGGGGDTVWRTDPSRILDPFLIDLADGVTLDGVATFRDVTVESHNTAVPVIQAKPENVAWYVQGWGSVKALGTQPFISDAVASHKVLLEVQDDGEVATGTAPFIAMVAAPGQFLTAVTEDEGLIDRDTLAGGGPGNSYGGRTSPSGFIDTAQAGLPGGVLAVAFSAQGKLVQYDDLLVAPPLGADQVQAAIDALKVIVAGGSPVHPGRYDLSVNDARVENASAGSCNMITGTMLNEVGAFTGSGPAPAHTGNKAMLGFKGHSGTPLGTVASIVWEWEEVAPPEPSPSLRYPYLNIVLQFAPALSYKILVIDPNLAVLSPPLNLGTLTVTGPNTYKFTHIPLANANFVQVINFASTQPLGPPPQPFMPMVSPPVVPAVVFGGSSSSSVAPRRSGTPTSSRPPRSRARSSSTCTRATTAFPAPAPASASHRRSRRPPPAWSCAWATRARAGSATSASPRYC